MTDIDWQSMETAKKDERILCAWKVADGWLIGTAIWRSPTPSMVEHWCFEGKWTPSVPVAWQPLPLITKQLESMYDDHAP